MRFHFFALLLTAFGVLSAQSRNLDIYSIDAEGGGATLIVSPSGESMLIDSGYAVGDRDAKRIYAAAQQAGLKKIDYVLISHYHPDHAGGLPALSKMIPLGHLFGRSNTELEQANQQWLDNFNNAAAAKRSIVKAGDTIPFKGVGVTVVIADGKPIAKPVNGGGAANPRAPTPSTKPPRVPRTSAWSECCSPSAISNISTCPIWTGKKRWSWYARSTSLERSASFMSAAMGG